MKKTNKINIEKYLELMEKGPQDYRQNNNRKLRMRLYGKMMDEIRDILKKNVIVLDTEIDELELNIMYREKLFDSVDKSCIFFNSKEAFEWLDKYSIYDFETALERGAKNILDIAYHYKYFLLSDFIERLSDEIIEELEKERQ